MPDTTIRIGGVALDRCYEYIRRIRNRDKAEYAHQWLLYRADRADNPEDRSWPQLSYMARQAVRMAMDDMLGL